MKNTPMTRFAAAVLVPACVLAASACGDGPTGSAELDAFAGDLMPLNTAVAGEVSGVSAFLVGEDANVFVAGVEPAHVSATVHPQHVHAGDTCPTEEHDDNGDGLISLAEGAVAYGGVLLPLDSILTDQAAGEFPIAEGSAYDYENSAALDAVLASLRGSDEDEFVELGPDEALDLANRVVVVHGVAEDAELPAGLDNTTLPIACAELERQDAE